MNFLGLLYQKQSQLKERRQRKVNQSLKQNVSLYSDKYNKPCVVISVLSELKDGTTVAISKQDLEKIHELCVRDDRTVKAVVRIALSEYFKGREV
jgi:hypothetical protein